VIGSFLVIDNFLIKNSFQGQGEALLGHLRS